MHKFGHTRHVARAIGIGVLITSVMLGTSSVASGALGDPTPSQEPTATEPEPEKKPAPSSDPTAPDSAKADSSAAAAEAETPPYGKDYPVNTEGTFSRPYKSISSMANSDFTLLNDLERLIRGTYKKPSGKLESAADRRAHHVYLTITRMENSHRVGRELIRAAKAGVKVRVLHGKSSQSKESRALQKALNKSNLRDASFKICQKGKSLACLSKLNAATLHSKILLVKGTYTRAKKPARNAIWTGSANLGGPSGERTWNNGWTVYNDELLWNQMSRMWSDMQAERNVGADYMAYIKKYHGRYGYSAARSEGYTWGSARHGMFYSNLSNTTIYATPIRASPTSGRDPIMNMLNRIIPDDKCRIRLQQNRFKYRRLSAAIKLVELADKGCTVSIVAFEDDLKVNRTMHCQIWVRVCRPILDELKTANRQIKVAYAKPHDKTMLVEAKFRENPLNKDELTPDGRKFRDSGERLKLVQAGSGSLTAASLASDEVTTESTDPELYEDYLQHYKAILQSREYRNYRY